MQPKKNKQQFWRTQSFQPNQKILSITNTNFKEIKGHQETSHFETGLLTCELAEDQLYLTKYLLCAALHRLGTKPCLNFIDAYLCQISFTKKKIAIHNELIGAATLAFTHAHPCSRSTKQRGKHRQQNYYVYFTRQKLFRS